MRRPLLLNGFMATGKSSVARLVAADSGRPFIDLDARIEERAGKSVTDLFRSEGEPRFREIEREELGRVLESMDAPVVALGGGALLDRKTRLRALDEAVVVTLQASPAEILKRVGSVETRPLLDVLDPGARIEDLLQQRRASYCESHAQIETTGRAPQAIASEAHAVWARDPIAVAAGDRSYAVDVGSGVLEALLPGSLRQATLLILVSDENVAPLHLPRLESALKSAGLRSAAAVLEPGERQKTAASVERIWRAALDAGADRSSAVVALGGGVVSDLAGFAAASFMRGIDWLAVPTTLLAMVDASVGGKTGFDLGPAKNAVGAFWQPRAVLCEVGLLATEPARGYVSALAEVVKTALIGDADLFGLLEAQTDAVRRRDAALVAELVRRSVRVKARVVGLDERESGLRATLNLGHTVGHALESQAGYSRLTHGEAVSLGLVAALRLGARRGLTPRNVVERAERLLAELGLPTDLSREPLAEASALIGHDKKRRGAGIRFVFAREVGRAEQAEISVDELRREVPELV